LLPHRVDDSTSRLADVEIFVGQSHHNRTQVLLPTHPNHICLRDLHHTILQHRPQKVASALGKRGKAQKSLPVTEVDNSCLLNLHESAPHPPVSRVAASTLK